MPRSPLSEAPFFELDLVLLAGGRGGGRWVRKRSGKGSEVKKEGRCGRKGGAEGRGVSKRTKRDEKRREVRKNGDE
jgi:hypothetical protein